MSPPLAGIIYLLMGHTIQLLQNRFTDLTGEISFVNRPGDQQLSNAMKEITAPRKPTYFFLNAEALTDYQYAEAAIPQAAEPFEAGTYLIKSSQENLPVAGEPVRLARTKVVIPPRAGLEAPGVLRCDALRAPNPEPSKGAYSFRLIGSFPAGPPSSLHNFELLCDPRRGDHAGYPLTAAGPRDLPALSC